MSLRSQEQRRPKALIVIGPWVRYRIHFAGAVLTLLFAAIGYRAYGLQVVNAGKYRQLAQRQHVRMVEVAAPRGPILDITGRELAVTADADSIYANPRDVVDVTATAEALAEVLGLDVRTIEARLATRRHFVWIKRHVTDREARAIRDLDLPGVYFTTEPRRFYSGKTLAGPVLGLAGIDGNGLEGIEFAMDDLLVGHKTRFAALRDAAGRVMMADGVAKSQPGATIILTIDRAVQYIAERALAAAVADNQAKAGVIVVLDVNTGGVMAMANFPTYDPNVPGSAAKARARNRAITDAFEIGSIMKVFTIAAALDAGVVAADERIDIEEGRFKVGRKVIRDTYRDVELSVGGIIQRSSNVGAVKVARRLGNRRLYDALRSYGFGSATGIELPGERQGRIRNPKGWGEIGLASMAFGYGMTVTAVQVAAGFAAIGADGVYRDARLIHEVRDATGQVLYQHRTEGRRVIQAPTARALLPMLASVFAKGRDGGTARALDPPPFPVGGKTGTARKVDPVTRQYSHELYVSSFAGLAPIDKPRIAVVVLIDEPRGEDYYGARVAGPAFVRVVDKALRYLGVPPTRADANRPPRSASELRDRSPRRPGELGAEPRRPPLAIADAPGGGRGPVAAHLGEPTIPDFTGMSIRRALDVARAFGLTVTIEGSGRAVSQVPPAGWEPPASEPRSIPCHIVFSQAPQFGVATSL